MEKYATASAMFTVQNLREKLDRLTTRYEHVSRDLKNKNEAKSIQSIRKLEREFLTFDIQRIKKLIDDANSLHDDMHRPFMSIRRRLV